MAGQRTDGLLAIRKNGSGACGSETWNYQPIPKDCQRKSEVIRCQEGIKIMPGEKGAAEFEGKVAVITGAARGIGRVAALEFSSQGAGVVLVDVLENELQQVADEIQKMERNVLFFKADVSDAEQVQRLTKKTVDHFKKIDILVNNAAIMGPVGPIIHLAEEDWDRIFQINLKSMFLFCKNIVPMMIKNRSGNIVNITSIAGKGGGFNLGAYAASKAGAIGFSRVLAQEVVKDGIRVNCIAPHAIKTEMFSSIPQDLGDRFLATVPMGRLGNPEEVVNLILFLASEKSSFITGQCFNVTGGRGDY